MRAFGTIHQGRPQGCMKVLRHKELDYMRVDCGVGDGNIGSVHNGTLENIRGRRGHIVSVAMLFNRGRGAWRGRLHSFERFD